SSRWSAAPGWARHALLTLGLLSAWPALAQDFLFSSGFDEPPEGPHTAAEAARFLTQATFGPTFEEIEHLRSIGYNAWFAEQLAAPSTLHLPYLYNLQSQGIEVYQNARQEAWWNGALAGQDQLRQRVAYALSQILVVSDQSGAIEGTPKGMAHYYDLLVAQAFGNYRQLLEDVTLHPVMGNYLSMFKNQKPDPVENIRPDENYAREIMQLFSVGLIQLNADGTPVLVNGLPVPSYDQTTIRGFAHVFTGWNWANCPRTNGGQPWEWQWCPIGPVPWPEPGWDIGWELPMQEWESYHAVDDTKQLLSYPGVSLPGGVLPAGGLARGNLELALDNVFGHPNVGPFLSYRLIQRLVSSNPSPQYVGRVAAVFNNNGQGVRGDLGATVRAVLMDPEARQLATPASGRGKLREPLLRVTQAWRALHASTGDGRYRAWNPEYSLAQAALRSPTVFNFYLPDFQPTGELSNLNLVAPEFQIMTDTYAARVLNGLGGNVYWSWIGNGGDPEDIRVNLAPGMALANNPSALVDYYSLLFTYRSMSESMFQTLVNHVSNISAGNDDGRRRRVQDTIWLIQSSPEYAIER
ncbi:MAG: DUF1800 domain-containing protein, partial [Xanthomonadales bacterium]|nr:DUF1800 domain-containing protein [Xanthomonadales bacterium]